MELVLIGIAAGMVYILLDWIRLRYYLGSPNSRKVLYLCDHKKCERCVLECEHTLDVRHARNFTKNNLGDYVEMEKTDGEM